MAYILSGLEDVYLEIANRFKNYIVCGVLKYGEKLPSVRTAAGEFGVNPNTVAKAYSYLESQGYISSVPKKGVFVTHKIGSEYDNTIDCKRLILNIKNLGVNKEILLKWIEEVYKDD